MPGTQRTLTGRVLTVTIEGVAMPAKRGRAKRMVDPIDTTSTESNGFKDKEAGLQSADGDATCVVPVAATTIPTEGDLADVVVAFTGGRSITIPALITEVTDDATYDGEYTVSITWQSRGEYTVS
jgi:hypothetical protein